MKKLLTQFIREVLDGFSMAGSRRMEAPGNLRYDVAVRPGGTEDDEVTPDDMNETEQRDSWPTREAACVLIVSDDGKILAVSRKNNPSDFGMPGGKVDPGETPIEAAARELAEETGLHTRDLKQVFCKFDGDSTCYTFVGTVDGDINTTESGVIRWVEPSVLLNSSFADYNRALLGKLGML